MNGICRLDAPFIIRLTCVGGKLLRLTAVEVHKGPGYRVAGDKQVGLGNGLEESPAYDLKALFRVGRTPGRLDAAKDILQTYRRFTSTLAASLSVRGGNGSDNQRLWCGLG